MLEGKESMIFKAGTIRSRTSKPTGWKKEHCLSYSHVPAFLTLRLDRKRRHDERSDLSNTRHSG